MQTTFKVDNIKIHDVPVKGKIQLASEKLKSAGLSIFNGCHLGSFRLEPCDFSCKTRLITWYPVCLRLMIDWVWVVEGSQDHGYENVNVNKIYLTLVLRQQ